MPLPKGRFDFQRHRTDVMDFLVASSESEEDVGGQSSSNELEADDNLDLLNQADDSDSSSSYGVGTESSGKESETETDKENADVSDRQTTVLGKDKVTVWSLVEPKKTVRRRRCNIVKDTSKGVSGISECWLLF